MHKLWLELTRDAEFSGLHHYHVVALALHELQDKLNTEERERLLERLLNDMLPITDPSIKTNEVSVDRRLN